MPLFLLPYGSGGGNLQQYIYGICKLTKCRSILEVLGQFIPVIQPRSNVNRILFSQFLFQLENVVGDVFPDAK